MESLSIQVSSQVESSSIQVSSKLSLIADKSSSKSSYLRVQVSSLHLYEEYNFEYITFINVFTLQTTLLNRTLQTTAYKNYVRVLLLEHFLFGLHAEGDTSDSSSDTVQGD